MLNANRFFLSMMALLVLCFMSAGPVWADDEATAPARSHRAGGFVTYAESYDGAGNYNFWSINPFWGTFLNDPGPGRIWSMEFALEGFFASYTGDFSSNYEVGLSPTLRWHYGFEESWSPYLEVSIGVLYTDLDIPEQGTEINYDVHVGGGINFRLQDDLYLNAGYRLRHLSNGGMSDRNKGVDYNQFVFGLSYYY